jgi:hypothetical protein
MMIITVHNPDPSVNITKEENITPISIELLQYASLPVQAVGEFSTPEMKSVSLVQIENLSLSENNDNLTLLVKPLDYHDGDILTPYARDTVNLQALDNKTFSSTGLYIEMVKDIPDNSIQVQSPCERCIEGCHENSICIIECDVFC